ncbi:hypothetical protein EWM64_g7707 [Hericium alpestre]|uniref:Uncharacterized protein n=1 Tax=Hericium alpestre TaxID=135208 RepID=A0A4Y9ZNW7_9AGAM|nr:hypothetical protein EWM64_g7707 [Hericium alpestre]
MATLTHSSDVRDPSPGPGISPIDIPEDAIRERMPSFACDSEGNYSYDMEYGCKVTPESEENRQQLLHWKLHGHKPTSHLPGYLDPYSVASGGKRFHKVYFGLGFTMQQLHDYGVAQGIDVCLDHPTVFAKPEDARDAISVVQHRVICHLEEICKESNVIRSLKAEMILSENYNWVLYLYSNRNYKKFKERVSQEEEDAIIKKIQSLLNITDPPMWYHADYSLVVLHLNALHDALSVARSIHHNQIVDQPIHDYSKSGSEAARTSKHRLST